MPVADLGPWQVIGWALVLAVAVAIVVTGLGVGLALTRGMWIAATLTALKDDPRTGDTDTAA